MAYTVLQRPGRRPRTVRPSKQESVGKRAAQAISGIQKSLDTLDKMHETRLKNTGLLDDYQWTQTIYDPTQETEQRTINMFKRADRDASLWPNKYYERTTTPTYERVVINPEYLNTGGTVENIKNRLTNAGYEPNQIRDILSGSEGVETLPFDFQGAPGANQIIGKESSKITNFLDSMKETFFGVPEASQVKGATGAIEKFGGELMDTSKFAEAGEIGKYSADITSKIGEGFASEATLPIEGGNLSAVTLPMSAVFAGKRALGGVKDMTEGNVGQGVEDVVQGGVDVVSTAMMSNPATAPAGITLKGLNWLEDMFFDKA